MKLMSERWGDASRCPSCSADQLNDEMPDLDGNGHSSLVFRHFSLVLCHSLILGLAVLALATVDAEKTVASAKTANLINPIF